MKLYTAGLVAALGGILLLAAPAEAKRVNGAKAVAKRKQNQKAAVAQQNQRQQQRQANQVAPTGRRRQETGLAGQVQHHNRPEYRQRTQANSRNRMNGQTPQEAQRNARQEVRNNPEPGQR